MPNISPRAIRGPTPEDPLPGEEKKSVSFPDAVCSKDLYAAAFLKALRAGKASNEKKPFAAIPAAEGKVKQGISLSRRAKRSGGLARLRRV